MDAKAIVNLPPELAVEILRCEVGSSAHGVGIPGSDDFDMAGVGIEVPSRVLGTGSFEHFLYRSAEVREGKKSVPSRPGDIDLTIFGLRKFARLAAKGNPSVNLLFYAPVMKSTALGDELRAASHLFETKNVGRSFLGYMRAQRHRLAGERGQKAVNRQELVDKYGFDTKYAMHVLRLGYQGLTFMETGKIEVPLDGSMRNFLLGVRQGRQNLNSVLLLAAEYEVAIEKALETSDMRDTPDMHAIDRLLVGLYKEAWEGYAFGYPDGY
jgi:predicted nucleotidyltransferase